MKLFTIGFTQTNAESFFGRLEKAGVKRLLDVRLNNTSQLAGFAKASDLGFFLRRIGGIEYRHEPMLAPTQAMLDGYRKQKGGWDNYERQFRDLIASRKIEQNIGRETLDGACLLCSEAKPHHCHRRVVAEYLRDHGFGEMDIVHL